MRRSGPLFHNKYNHGLSPRPEVFTKSLEFSFSFNNLRHRKKFEARSISFISETLCRDSLKTWNFHLIASLISHSRKCIFVLWNEWNYKLPTLVQFYRNDLLPFLPRPKISTYKITNIENFSNTRPIKLIVLINYTNLHKDRGNNRIEETQFMNFRDSW